MVLGPASEPASEKQRTPLDTSPEFGTAGTPGYHTLASVMGRDSEYAIFRKFSSLNALNLMRLQAELLQLEESYKLILLKYERNTDGVALSSCFKALQDSDSEQKEVLDKIGAKLEVYNSALIKNAQVAALSSPKESALPLIREWLRGNKEGEGRGFLEDGNPQEVVTWDEYFEKDFISLRQLEQQDRWSSRIIGAILKIWKYTYGRSKAPNTTLGVIEYSNERLEKITQLIISVLSAMVPSLAILVLFYEKDLLNRIWIMMGLTVAFAALLTVFTDAKRIEIFSATAAFVAVEVVFIGSTDVSNSVVNIAYSFNGTLSGILNETLAGRINGSMTGT